MQYGQQEKRLREMNSQTEQLEQKNQKLKMAENTQRIVTDGVILIAGVLMAAVCGHFAEQGTVSADQAMVAVIAMISSFGPTAHFPHFRITYSTHLRVETVCWTF